jgi:hypothetical protein
MYENWNEEDYLEEDEYPISRAAQRRKNDWKFANRRREILGNDITKPLHYYSKNMPESHAVDKRQMRRKQRQIDNFENQMEELFD